MRVYKCYFIKTKRIKEDKYFMIFTNDDNPYSYTKMDDVNWLK